MRKYFLDGNIFDEILSNLEVRIKLKHLCATGTVLLIGTWIESAEIDAMSHSKHEKWLAISELLSQLTIVRVPVAGIILDHSKIGETRLIGWDQSALLSNSLKSSGQNQNDMAMAMTAKQEGAVLVTKDLEMQKKARTIIEVPVVGWEEFVLECLSTNFD
jgi:predicted nucleic acid-binding protein